MNQRGRSVLILGATGLVGRECLRLLLNDPTVARVVALVRRRPDEAGSSKLQTHIVDFDRLDAHGELFEVDQVVCALGTTMNIAGSKEAFRRVDYEYPLAAAKLGLAHGATHFLVVSALGANAASRIFYNRVKGEIEDVLRTLGYRSVTVLRPSLLIGDRQTTRIGEEIGRRVGFLAPGKYRPVQARDVAIALVDAARTDQPGLRIIESDEIRRIAR